MDSILVTRIIIFLNVVCSLKDISSLFFEDMEEKYFIRGEDEKALIKCKKSPGTNPIDSGNFFQFISYSSVKAGWYINGDPDKNDTGNILIKCHSLSTFISKCIESRGLKEEYVVNTASK